jgi:chemotaxis protein methyltransferase CheR
LIVEDSTPANASIASPAVIDLELSLLLEAVQRVSGHDFREYAPAMLRRRVLERVRSEGAATISGLQERVLHHEGSMERFVDAVTFNPSTPFADPAFFKDFVTHVLPRLRTYPHVRVWFAGCGAGDDAYALAALCKEADFLDRVRIYATDASESAMERARAGTLARSDLEEIQLRYARSGGTARFEEYVEPDGQQLRYAESLRSHIVFAQHNLATDGSFNEFHLIIVRHALAKYNRVLVYHAHQVLYESLVRLGFLYLGAKESLRFTPHQKAYDALAQAPDFYRRIR